MRPVCRYGPLNGGKKFEPLGGGVGTVGAAGGWLQGGGLSTGLERLWGFGVDQVLELEMVLADGSHVWFGPFEWQQQVGYLYPKTTKVAGKCNINVSPDETAWEWVECDNEIPFADLWLAVRGGGGGTYGVVTAVHYQLNDQWSWYGVGHTPVELAAVKAIPLLASKHNFELFEDSWFDFWIDVMFSGDPDGLACGSDSLTLSLSGDFQRAHFTSMYCKDGPAQQIVARWKQHVDSTLVGLMPALKGYESELHALVGLPFPLQTSFAEFKMTFGGGFDLLSIMPLGHVPDNPVTADSPFAMC